MKIDCISSTPTEKQSDMDFIDFLPHPIDADAYFAELSDLEPLNDPFAEFNINDALDFQSMDDVENIDSPLLRAALQSNEETKQTVSTENSLDRIDEANDSSWPQYTLFNDVSLMLHDNPVLASTAPDDFLFTLLDSNIIPQMNEESILQQDPAQIVEIQSGVFPDERHGETIDSSSIISSESIETPNYDFLLALDPISVQEQPKADLRARYGSDGPRFLPGSRKRPMSILLPDLTSVPLREGYRWGIVTTMVTGDDNPQHKTLLHANQLIYRTADALQITPQSVFVPLDLQDLQMRQKKFPRASIICTKYDDYTFQITDFDQGSAGGETIKYLPQCDISHMTKAAIAKLFVKEYRLESYRFIFQLAEEKNGEISIFPNRCETHLITEKRQPKVGDKGAKTASAQKRKADGEPSEKPSAKKPKSSPTKNSCSTKTTRLPKRSPNRLKDHS